MAFNPAGPQPPTPPPPPGSRPPFVPPGGGYGGYGPGYWPVESSSRVKRWWGRYWRSARRLARRLCAARRGDYDDLPNVDDYTKIQTLYKARTYAGIGFWLVLRIIGLVAAHNGPVTFEQFLTLGSAYWLSPLVIIVVSCVLYSATETGNRARTARQLLIPCACSLFLLLYLIGGFFISGDSTNSSSQGSVHPDSSGATGPQLLGFIFIGVPLILLCLWAMIVVVWSVGLTVVDQCRVIDGHPYLGAVAGIVTSWVAVGYGYIFGSSAFSVVDGAPSLMIQAGNWGGPLTVTAICLYEIRYLRSIGLRIKGGSLPAIPFTG